MRLQRNKKYPWVVFYDEELLFRCNRCKKEWPWPSDSPIKAAANHFQEQHKDCKEET